MEAQRLQEVKKSTIIKLDIDGEPVDFHRIKVCVAKLKEMKMKFIKGEVYKTVHGFHVYIWIMNTVSDTYLPFIQALMGSDWKRELLNFERILKAESDWNVLFQEKEVLQPAKSKKLTAILL
jgi:hypothetical protein